MRRIVPLSLALAVVAAGVSVAVPSASASPATPDVASAPAAPAAPSVSDAPAAPGASLSAAPSVPVFAKRTPTRFALRSAGYGTRVQGGQIPASSGTSAYAVIACTNLAGITHKNFEAAGEMPGLGTLEGVKTKVWTKIRPKKHDVSAYSRHHVAKVVLGGQLTITAVNSLSHAWHDRSGFHTETSTSIGGISAGGQAFPIPTPGTPLVIPGVASITVGSSHESKNSNSAKATADAVDIMLLASDTRVRIAHSGVQLSNGITSGIFVGSSNASRASGPDDALRSGPTPLSLMPCQGTRGKILGKDMAGLNLGGQIVIGALSTRQMGKQTAKQATGFEQATMSGIDLGAGQLVIAGIRGQANVTRSENGNYKTSSLGTTIGEITANGEPQQFPDTGVLEIPGVARLESNIVKKSSIGITVTALRITMLDGTGAVINLGQARLYIRRSGL